MPPPVAAVTPSAPAVVPVAPNPPPAPVAAQTNFAVNDPAGRPRYLLELSRDRPSRPAH